MAKKSKKKAKASRANGSKGKGPVTPEGKEAVRFNALKDGLFTKELIVAAAGEQKEDFERLKDEMWKFFEPENPFEEMLVIDIIENRWRLQRVRRAESISLQKRLELISRSNWMSDLLKTSDRIQTLKAKFLNSVRKYPVFAADPQRQIDTFNIADQLEDMRQELLSTSVGAQFLIEQLNSVQKEAGSDGYLSPEGEILLLACCGFADKDALLVLAVSRKVRSQSARTSAAAATATESASTPDSPDIKEEDVKAWIMARMLVESVKEAERQVTEAASAPPKAERGYSAAKDKGPRAGQKKEAKRTEAGSKGEEKSTELPKDEARQMIFSLIGAFIGQLKGRKEYLAESEKVGLEAEKAEAIAEPGRSERFVRAETAVERRLYRALAMMIALRKAQSFPPSIPATGDEIDSLSPSTTK